MTIATIIPSFTNNPPSRANPAAFPTDGDSFLNGLPGLVSGVNTVATELNTWNSDISELQYSAGLSATNASNSKDTSLGNARLAASWFLSEWVSGTTYPAGQIVYSNVDGREYKRITAGAGTTDPSSDTTNWEPLGWEYITNYPDIRPTLDLNFAGSQAVDPRITFTRNSIATYFDKFGVMQTAGVNQPRIDFDPVTGECKGLLIEEQRTNLLLNSNSILSASLAGGVLSTNSLMSPDGTINASTLRGNGSALSTWIQNATATSTTMTFSCFVKTGLTSTRSSWVFLMRNWTSAIDFTFGVFNSSNGTISGAGWNSVNVGGGWYRISYTNTVGQTISVGDMVACYLGATGGSPYSATDIISVWGVQLEAGAFPTSYIPTTSSAVTRQADNASMTGTNFSSWYRQDEGTFFAQASFMGATASSFHGLFSAQVDGNNRIGVYSLPSGGGLGFDVRYGSVQASASPVSGDTASVLNRFSRVGLAYANNDFAATRDGGAMTIDTAGSVPYVNILLIGRFDDIQNGHLRKLTYYPKRLPNATLQTITQP